MVSDPVMHHRHHDREISAKAAMHALCDRADSSDDDALGFNLLETKRALVGLHKANIVVKNALKYMIHDLAKRDAKTRIHDKREELHKRFIDDKDSLLRHVKAKTFFNKTVFVHSINNELLYVIEGLKRSGEKYRFNTLKATDLYGDKHILSAHSPVYYGDLDLHSAVKDSDICIVGVDLVKHDRIFAKKGTLLSAQVAKKMHRPFYACATSLYLDSHDKHIDIREYGHLYEEVEFSDLSGIISELGIHKPQHFVHEALFFNKWLLSKDLV